MTMLTKQEIRRIRAEAEKVNYTTHWQGCQKYHPLCEKIMVCNTALEALERVEQLERLCLERKVKINKLTEAIERVIRFFRTDKDKLPFAIEYAEERMNDVLNPQKEGE